DNAGRNLDVEFLAVRQPDALLAALDRFFQRDGHGDIDVEIDPDPAGVEFELGPTAGSGPRAAHPAAEHAVENVLERARALARTGAAATEIVALETAGTRAPARPAAAWKALEARLAVGV